MRSILYSGILLVVAPLFVLLMTGCLLYVLTPYYHPAAPGGTVVRAVGDIATNSVILFERQGVVVGINIVIGNKVDASISFEVPEGKVVQLLDHHIELFAASQNSWKSNLSGWIWTGAGRTAEYPVDAPMVGKSRAHRFGTAKGYGNTLHAAFFFQALVFDEPKQQTFSLKMPKFYVNSIEVELPLIEFTLDSERLWISLP